MVFNEDISQYNAIDRTCGEAMLKNINTNDEILLTGGRISAEMLAKVAK